MKTICILSAVNIKHMSLISIYTKYFKENNLDYDIIYMDKYNENEIIGAKKKYRFINVINPKWSKLHKVFAYSKFFWYAKKILKKENYDKIIVWGDIAILMFGLYLSKYCEKKYCLNCRDYSGEKNPIIYRIFKKTIKKSYFTTISSDGFKSFLPLYDYINLHSFNESLLVNCLPKQSLAKDPIRIGFIGNVRFFAENYKLMNILKNDNRFELHYYGTNAEVIEEYAQNNGFNNVICSGNFPVNKTKEYLAKCDIINNIFGNNSIAVKTLTSIRLFHAAYMNMPILVSKSTYMEKLINEYNIGYVVDFKDNNLANHIYEWYRNICFPVFKRNCACLINMATESNKIFYEKLKDFLDYQR